MAYLQPDFCQFFDNILFPLQITELLIQLSNELRTRRRHGGPPRLTNATTSDPMSGMYLLKVAISLE